MKKIAWILIVAAMAAAMAVPGVALANIGPHGGYVADTDLCAQCHRAHTAPSTITWTDSTHAQKNALLTASDSTLSFCLACHDDASQGADTNVIGGTYQGDKYGTKGGNLISGAFGGVNASKSTTALVDQGGNVVTSFHITTEGSTWGAFGGGTTGNVTELLGTGNKIVMTCTTCHDPHGSSNYRILKDVVNGVTVGGYDAAATGTTDPFGNDWSVQNPKPTPFVISDEKGFPQGGFQLHVSYAATYSPDYTVAQYAKAPNNDTGKGMSGWCAGCHTQYIVADATTPTLVSGVPTVLNGSTYNSGDGLGFIDRHRHSVNVALASYTGTSTMITDVSLGLPLDHDPSEKKTTAGAGVHNSSSDWIECLTCHNAHGTTATMTGYANFTTLASGDVGYRGVLPDYSNLLKKNNRGVCEACHNK